MSTPGSNSMMAIVATGAYSAAVQHQEHQRIPHASVQQRAGDRSPTRRHDVSGALRLCAQRRQFARGRQVQPQSLAGQYASDRLGAVVGGQARCRGFRRVGMPMCFSPRPTHRHCAGGLRGAGRHAISRLRHSGAERAGRRSSPAGKGPLWFIQWQAVTLIDQGTRMMGTYLIDANGNIVPQFIGGENLTR